MPEVTASMCAHCGAEFSPYRPQNRYCSKRCYHRAYYEANKAKWETPEMRARARANARKTYERRKSDDDWMASRAASHRRWYEENAVERAAQVRAYYRKTKKPTTCRQCGKPFLSFDGKRGICSDECRLERARQASRATEARRRAALSFRYTQRDIDRLLNRHRGLCAYCGENDATEIDHVVPIARGGVDGIANLLPSCMACNRAKTDKLLSEWRHGRKRRR